MTPTSVFRLLIVAGALMLGGCASLEQTTSSMTQTAPKHTSAEQEKALKLAHLLRNNGRMQAAFVVYQRMDKKGELSGAYLLEYASVAALVQPPQQALALYDRARKSMGSTITPKEQLALELGIGRARLSLGLTDLAAADFNKALKLEPSNAQALNGLGILASLAGEADTAQHYFQQVLSADPGFTPALNNLALAYLADGHTDKAIRLLKPSAANGDIALQLNLALAYVMDAKPAEARALLSTRLSADYVHAVLANFDAVRQRIDQGEPAAQELLAASQQPLSLKDQE